MAFSRDFGIIIMFMKKKFCLFIILAATVIFVAPVDRAAAFSLGEIKTFNVGADYDELGRTQLSATLRQIGDHALFYVDSAWWDKLSAPANASAALAAISGEFDNNIYPRLTKIYGSEWNPGIDNEARIYILIAPMKKESGGYFNTFDEYPKLHVPLPNYSNEREMIYLNSLYLGSASFKGFLAHEFQHLTNFYQKEKLRNVTEETWLNEARSEYAPTLLGYDTVWTGSNLERRARDFLRDPGDSLTEWTNQPADYGAVNLFMQYLVGRYSEKILTKITQSDAVGIKSIDQALAEMGVADRFSDIFTNWTIANHINDCQLGDGQRLCYLDSNLSYEHLHANPTLTNILEAAAGVKFSFADVQKDWAGRWYKILPSGGGFNLIFDFAGAGGANFKVPVVVYYASGAKSVRYLALNKTQRGAELFSGFGQNIQSIVFIPQSQTKTSGFSANEPAYSFLYNVEMTNAGALPPEFLKSESAAATSTAVTAPIASVGSGSQATSTPQISSSSNFPDGSLIRVKGDTRVYVVQGKYRRWLRTPEIFNSYGHLRWENIIEVMPTQRDFYQESSLIRAAGDTRVYEIDSRGLKHWLRMSAAQFLLSGRNFSAVFEVNQRERDLYARGADILK